MTPGWEVAAAVNPERLGVAAAAGRA